MAFGTFPKSASPDTEAYGSRNPGDREENGRYPRVAMDWKDIHWFHQVVIHSSFSAAARANQTTQATISRRIKALEQSVGRDLFVRGAEDGGLTDTGQALTSSAERMNDGYMAFLETVRQLRTGTQKLVVTCGSLIGMHLSKNIGRLYEGLDNTEIEIKTANAFLDLEKGEADLALRNKRPDKGQLKSHRINARAYGRCAVYGSDKHFTAGQITQRTHLKRHKWIGLARKLGHLPTARWIETHVGADAVKFRMNSTLLILEAVVENDALALLPVFIGDATAGLVPVYGPVEDLKFEMWMVRRDNDIEDQALQRLMANVESLFISPMNGT